MTDRIVISQSTIDEVARVGREWPDGIHTCAELQRLEPGRRPCTCGRCPDPDSVTAMASRLLAEYRHYAEDPRDADTVRPTRWMEEAADLLERIAGESC